MSDVVVVGNNCLDLVFEAPQLMADSKIQAESARPYGGGQAGNVAAALAFLGVSTSYAGRFGDDPFGDFSREAFERAGVSTTPSRVIDDCPQHLAAVIVDRSASTRSIVMHKDARLRCTGDDADAIPLAGCRLVYSDGHEPAIALRLAERARGHAIPVMSDAEEVSDALQQILPLLRWLIAPRSVVLSLGGSSNFATAAAALLKRGPVQVVATQGANGSEGFSARGEHIAVAAEQCTVVDTTGAGDAYHAGFACAALGGADLRDAMGFATRVAAAKCGIRGPRLDRAAALRLIRSPSQPVVETQPQRT